jgi:hypothetical protein
MGQTLATNVIKFGDPYGHHGELAMLYRVEQHTQSRGSSYPAYRSKDGLGAPYYNTIKTRLPERPNLYVVPSLSSAENDQAEQSQRALMRCLTPGDRARFFQPHKNLKPGGLLGIGNHMMGEYMTHITHRLLAAINPKRVPLLAAQKGIKRFEQQMDKYSNSSPEHEHRRNIWLLSMHQKAESALTVTQKAEGGVEALLRLDALEKDVVWK